MKPMGIKGLVASSGGYESWLFAQFLESLRDLRKASTK